MDISDLRSHWEFELRDANAATASAMARAERANEMVQRQSRIITAQQIEIVQLKCENAELRNNMHVMDPQPFVSDPIADSKPPTVITLDGNPSTEEKVDEQCLDDEHLVTEDNMESDCYIAMDGDCEEENELVEDEEIVGQPQSVSDVTVHTESANNKARLDQLDGMRRPIVERVRLVREAMTDYKTMKEASKHLGLSLTTLWRWRTDMPMYEQMLSTIGDQTDKNVLCFMPLGYKGKAVWYPKLEKQLHVWLDSRQGGTVDIATLKAKAKQFACENTSNGVAEANYDYRDFKGNKKWLENVIRRHKKK